MSYQILTNEKKLNVELPDAAFQCPFISQLTELKHTRRILLFLTSIQFVVSLCIIFGIIFAHIFGYVLGGEWNHPMVQLVPILSCTCFLIGSLAAERYHVKGLLVFIRLAMVYLIVTFFIVTIYIAIPICWKIYPTSIIGKIIFAITYEMIFCMASLVPAYTINKAKRLFQLMIDNNYYPIK